MFDKKTIDIDSTLARLRGALSEIVESKYQDKAKKLKRILTLIDDVKLDLNRKASSLSAYHLGIKEKKLFEAVMVLCRLLTPAQLTALLTQAIDTNTLIAFGRQCSDDIFDTIDFVFLHMSELEDLLDKLKQALPAAPARTERLPLLLHVRLKALIRTDERKLPHLVKQLADKHSAEDVMDILSHPDMAPKRVLVMTHLVQHPSPAIHRAFRDHFSDILSVSEELELLSDPRIIADKDLMTALTLAKEGSKPSHNSDKDIQQSLIP